MTDSSQDTAADWSRIIQGGAGGANSIAGSYAEKANSKIDRKEAKRRTLAHLMNQSMKRNRGLFRKGQEHRDAMNDYQSQSLQQVSRGLAEALQGSTGRT